MQYFRPPSSYFEVSYFTVEENLDKKIRTYYCRVSPAVKDFNSYWNAYIIFKDDIVNAGGEVIGTSIDLKPITIPVEIEKIKKLIMLNIENKTFNPQSGFNITTNGKEDIHSVQLSHRKEKYLHSVN
jgi:hypothetical protein